MWLAGLIASLLVGHPEASRLAGQTWRPQGSGYTIIDIAGEGPPIVGHVRKRHRGLYLEAQDGCRYRLAGKLARPRIAGPNYKVWIIGEMRASGLNIRRIGILAPPSDKQTPTPATAGPAAHHRSCHPADT